MDEEVIIGLSHMNNEAHIVIWRYDNDEVEMPTIVTRKQDRHVDEARASMIEDMDNAGIKPCGAEVIRWSYTYLCKEEDNTATVIVFLLAFMDLGAVVFNIELRLTHYNIYCF
ncbi:hypothetical protein SESBI_34701 [Sesbania bispinosa]|nr:hypothetical protein SESBI_34701 [Sesbania bispinosa]